MGRPKGSKNKHSIKVSVICPTCGKTFEKFPSYVRKNDSKGCLVYCSRECSDANRQNVWKLFGEKTSNFKNGLSSYRQLAIRRDGTTCKICGYDGEAYPSLIWVHHIDFDHSNNDPLNLEVLCIRCHLEKHIERDKQDALSECKTETLHVQSPSTYSKEVG